MRIFVWVTGNYDWEAGGIMEEADTEFIAHAPEDIAHLLSMVQEQAQKIKAVESAVMGHPKCSKYSDNGPISCGWKSAYLDVVHALSI